MADIMPYPPERLMCISSRKLRAAR
jgi:hypothetical protein